MKDELRSIRSMVSTRRHLHDVVAFDDDPYLQLGFPTRLRVHSGTIDTQGVPCMEIVSGMDLARATDRNI